MAFPHHIFCFLLKSSFTFLVQFEFLLVRETVLNMKYFEMCNKSKAEGCDFALKFNRCQKKLDGLNFYIFMKSMFMRD